MLSISCGISPHFALVLTAWEADVNSISPPEKSRIRALSWSKSASSWIDEEMRSPRLSNLDALAVEEAVHCVVGSFQKVAVDIQRPRCMSGRSAEEQAGSQG